MVDKKLDPPHLDDKTKLRNSEKFKKYLSFLAPPYKPQLLKLTHPQFGSLYILETDHNYSFELTEQLISILKQSTYFACESTDVALRYNRASKKNMDTSLMNYAMNNTNAHVFSLESYGEQRQICQVIKNASEGLLKEKEFKSLFDKRNSMMVSRIMARLNAKKENILFVAVGYSHLQGPNNMLELLQAEGFTYEDIELLEDRPEAGFGLS